MRPTDFSRRPQDLRLEGDMQRLYELIWQRTIASQMADAVGTSVSIRLAGTSTTNERAEIAARLVG